MARYSNHHQHWDEFRWEEEIRRDERRISGYFRELAGCIDLPDEEELIYGQLAGQQDLVPSPENNENLRSFFSGDECEDDDAAEHQAVKRSVESATVDELDMLCAEWNIFTASVLPEKLRRSALCCSCAFAKLLARTADFMEPDEGTSNALLRSIGKRCLRDLNDTVAILGNIGVENLFFRERTAELISRLGEIRERIIARLDVLR